MLVGGVVGLAVGGLLTGVASWAPFALTAVLVPLLVLPTMRRVVEPPVDRGDADAPDHSARTTSAPRRGPACAASCSRRSSGFSATRRCRPSSSSTRRRSSGSAPASLRSGSPASASPPVRGSRSPAACATRSCTARCCSPARPPRRRLPRRRRLHEPRAGRRRARPRRRGLRARLRPRLPALLDADPARRGRRLHRALLLRPRDLLDDRAPRGRA